MGKSAFDLGPRGGRVSLREQGRRKEANRKHYFLFAGEGIVRQEETIVHRRLNTVLSSENSYVNAQLLAKSQTAIQMVLIKEVNDPNAVIMDVYLYSISYMGYMTHEEYIENTQAIETPELNTPASEAANA